MQLENLKSSFCDIKKTLKITPYFNSMKVEKEEDDLDSACTIHDVMPSHKYKTVAKKVEFLPSAFNQPPKICKQSVFKRSLSSVVIKEGNILKRLYEDGKLFSPNV